MHVLYLVFLAEFDTESAELELLERFVVNFIQGLCCDFQILWKSALGAPKAVDIFFAPNIFAMVRDLGILCFDPSCGASTPSGVTIV
jgi:hypothetical protein